LMERGETVLEALQRIGREQEDKRKEEEGKRGKKKTWAERQKERKAAMAVDEA
jgi:CD2 antigen cytoplasmic tail-binding protein 2